jgi:hypothetical protein
MSAQLSNTTSLSGYVPIFFSRRISPISLVIVILSAPFLLSFLLFISPQSCAQTSSDYNETKPKYCSGDCALTISIGPRLETTLRSALALEQPYTAPWNWKYGNSGIVSATLSKRYAWIEDTIYFEPEMGLGQRYGALRETEAWVALYARWVRFPWNDFLRTSLAVSTGLNFASDIALYEETRGKVPGGSRLQHYFSPEITFGLPDKPDVDLVFRFHHRSGGAIVGNKTLFNGTDGGVQHFVIGLRYRF